MDGSLHKAITLLPDKPVMLVMDYKDLFCIVVDTYDAHEAKTFFDKNYSLIYYIFHDVFTSVETDLRQRGKLITRYCSTVHLNENPQCPETRLLSHSHSPSVNPTELDLVSLWRSHICNFLNSTKCIVIDE